jgi:hypothetical protein
MQWATAHARQKLHASIAATIAELRYGASVDYKGTISHVYRTTLSVEPAIGNSGWGAPSAALDVGQTRVHITQCLQLCHNTAEIGRLILALQRGYLRLDTAQVRSLWRGDVAYLALQRSYLRLNTTQVSGLILAAQCLYLGLDTT